MGVCALFYPARFLRGIVMPGEKFWGIVKEDRNKISGKNTIGIVITFWDFLEEDRKGILKMSYPHTRIWEYPNLDKSDICMSNNLNKHATRCDRDHIKYLALPLDRCQTYGVDLAL